jgi:hypothetical protein
LVREEVTVAILVAPATKPVTVTRPEEETVAKAPLLAEAEKE